ncbi:MAG: response regulator [Lachnospiraceae bacterium]|nr:response regulator [Lachnospiraceae bacterium]
MYRLLVADDESIERMVLCKILRKQMGDICEVYEAKNGIEAVDVFEKKDIQIAIIDIEMPRINGLEAARRMRKQKEDCVIIFLTAFDEFSYAKQAISVRALEYLLKPYDEKELLFVIEEGIREIEKNAKKSIIQLFDVDEIIKEGKSSDIRISFVKEFIENYIKEHYTEDISMQQLAREMNYSEAYFCKLFKQCFRVNFTTYLAEYRVRMAKKMLENPLANIKDVGKACGYTDSNYFSRVFKRSTGYTPTEYRLVHLLEKNG